MTSTEIQTIAAIIQALAALVFLGSVFYDAVQRKRRREQERREDIIKALNYEFDAAHGFPARSVYSTQNITTDAQAEDYDKEKRDFVNTRLKQMGETWTYPDRK